MLLFVHLRVVSNVHKNNVSGRMALQDRQHGIDGDGQLAWDGQHGMDGVGGTV